MLDVHKMLDVMFDPAQNISSNILNVVSCFIRLATSSNIQHPTFLDPTNCNNCNNYDTLLDTLNPLCSCSLETECTEHFFLRCQNYITIRQTLFNELKRINPNVLNFTDRSITQILLYGDPKFDEVANKMILKAIIEFIVNSRRLERTLF